MCFAGLRRLVRRQLWSDGSRPVRRCRFVWLDFRNGGADFVALMQPANKAKLDQLIAKGNRKDPSTVVYEKFRDWVVLGQTKSIIHRFEQASDSAKGMLSGSFKESIHQLSGDAIVRAYVNGQAVMGLVRKQRGAGSSPLSTSSARSTGSRCG